MAESRLSESLCYNGTDNCGKGTLSTFLTRSNCNRLSFMSYDGIRLKWAGELKDLEQVVFEVFGLEGRWSSPGGRAKKFTSSNADLSVTWYQGKQDSLIFQGEDGYLVRDKCIYFCKQEPRLSSKSKPLACNRGQISCSARFELNSVAVTESSNISCCDYDTDSNTIVAPNPAIVDDYLPAIGKGTDVNCACSIGNLNAEVAKMKLDIKALQSLSKPQAKPASMINPSQTIALLEEELHESKLQIQKFKNTVGTLEAELFEYKRAHNNSLKRTMSNGSNISDPCKQKLREMGTQTSDIFQTNQSEIATDEYYTYEICQQVNTLSRSVSLLQREIKTDRQNYKQLVTVVNSTLQKIE